MKKGRRFIISKVSNGDFSLDEGSAFSLEPSEQPHPFPDFDIPPVNYTGNQEHDAADELRYVHDSLLWADKHPPQTGDVLDSPVFLTVVFESRSQKETFLENIGMYKYGDKYFSFKDWFNAFDIDVKKGIPVSIRPLQSEEENLSFSAGNDFDFSGFGKKESPAEKVGETLKNIRADEKHTADYLAWAVDPSFWFCICFETEEQKANFQKSLGVLAETYAGFDLIWGHDFAAPFHVELEPCDFKPRLWSGREDKRLVALTWKGEFE